MLLYRIAYVSASEAHSIVRQLPGRPLPGDRIALEQDTVVTVRKVVPRAEGDTIAADVIAEVSDGQTMVADASATPAAPPDTASRRP